MHLPLAALTLLLVASSEATNETDPYKGYRLPGIQIPSRYQIDLHLSDTVFTGDESSFNGSVSITFQVTEDTTEIKLHSAVTIDKVTLLPSTTIFNHTWNSTTEILTIPLTTTLIKETDYNLAITYTGQLDTSNMLGFYRSQYDDAAGTQYLVTTQFESTYARRAFPCFDEPKYKASYVLTMKYPEEFEAISNTPINTLLKDNGYKTTIFTETPLMSSYLVAFTVSRFNCSEGQDIDTNITHRVCSRPETTADRDLATEYGTKIMNALGNHFGYRYQDMKIKKMDQLAIPDFNAGAMENWGMVTYKENALLYNEDHTSSLMKQRVIAIIAHEFTHMWFGDLVTLEWWDYTFLNEGFARYFQYFISTKIPELVDYEMNEQFVVEVQQTAFLVDSSTSSDSLTSKVVTPSEISSKFGLISYNKGASILRMLAGFMGIDNFTNALRDYLRQNAYSTSVPEKLWNVMANYTPSDIPSNVSFSEIIDNWSNKAGYPLVTVSKNGTDLIVTQKRFLYSGSDDTQWYVPISYTLSNDENKFENISARFWLRPNATHIIQNALENNEWIILNNKGSAYYRVNYDTYLWEKIRSIFSSNHTLIDKINRAQIVDDTLNLARSGHILYSEAFQTLDYLRIETCYYPWYSAIEGFNYLLLRLGDDSILSQKVKSRILYLMGSVKKFMSLSNLTGENHIDTLKIQKVSTLACKLGDENCVRASKELFLGYKNGSVSIDKNVRLIVYCNALRYSDDIDSDWEYLWNILKNTSQANEVTNIITALGCTRSTKYLRYYLEQSVNASSGIRIQNLPELWASVYSSSTEGLEVAFDFLTKNHSQIYAYFSKASSLLSAIVERFTTNTQLERLQTFIDYQSANSSIKSLAESALIKAKINFEWVSSKKEDLERHFGISSASGVVISLCAMLPTLIISMMIFN